MAVLAMDTATLATVVAVGTEAGLLVGSAVVVPRAHSRILQPLFQSALETAGISPLELERIVVGVGPGSYTGVRLGVATAKAMAAALNVPLTPVPTLHAMAEAAAPGNRSQPAVVLSLLSARRQRAFGTIRRKDGLVWKELEDKSVRPVAKWLELLAAHSGQTACIVIHDLSEAEPDFPAPVLATWLQLRAAAPALGPALLAVGRNAPSLSGLLLHQLTPDYALPVEAEARLGEGGGNGNATR